MLSEKSKYVAYLYVLETIQIASQVNTKTTTRKKKKKKKDNTYTLRGYLMPSKLGETLMSHLKRPSITWYFML